MAALLPLVREPLAGREPLEARVVDGGREVEQRDVTVVLLGPRLLAAAARARPRPWLAAGGHHQALVVAVVAPGHGVAVTQRHVAARVVVELEHGGGHGVPWLLARPRFLLEHGAVEAVRQVAGLALLLAGPGARHFVR